MLMHVISKRKIEENMKNEIVSSNNNNSIDNNVSDEPTMIGPIGLVVLGSVPLFIIGIVSTWYYRGILLLFLVLACIVFLGSYNIGERKDDDDDNNNLNSSSKQNHDNVNLFFKKRYKYMDPYDILQDIKYQLSMLEEKQHQQEKEKEQRQTNPNNANDNNSNLVKNTNAGLDGNVIYTSRDDKNDINRQRRIDNYWKRTVLVKGMQALGSKYREVNNDSNRTTVSSSSSSSSTQKEVSLLCLQAASFALKEAKYSIGMIIDDNDIDRNVNEIVLASFTLLTIVAKDRYVREQNAFTMQSTVKTSTANQNTKTAPSTQKDSLFEIIIDTMNRSIERTIWIANNESNNNNSGDDIKNNDDDGDDDELEHTFADIQQKGCFLLGAYCDDAGTTRSTTTNNNNNNTNIAVWIGTTHGGINSIVNAMKWYKYHDTVIQWGIWCIFTLLYENNENENNLNSSSIVNKMTYIRDCDGINVTIQILKQFHSSNITTTRHAVAVLFDLLRDVTHTTGCIDVWKVRNAAIACGLQEAIVDTINVYVSHRDAEDIVLMGQQLLYGTNYQGPCVGTTTTTTTIIPKQK